MDFCEVNGHRLHYKILQEDKLGKGLPVLVFLHEGLGSIAQWKDFPEVIAGRLHLPALLYDRYGYGKSDILNEERDGKYLWSAATDELPALLDQLKINDPLVLIGHSDGATIALMYASRFPERVKAVVSEAAHVFLEEISRDGIKNTMRLFNKTRLREFLERYHGDRTEKMFYGWAHTWTSDLMDRWEMKKELSLITAPILAIQGENDEFATPEQLNWIKTYCKGHVELALIPECAHIPHFQRRELITGKMIEFIKKWVNI
jgi:pimeloyl-ACP methyl ester carboxylesterase